jgi:phosphoribosylformylglycinamidine synthase subunit PurS
MYHAVIKVTLRPSILDPEGKTVERSMHQLGYHHIRYVRMGKLIELDIEVDSEEDARKTVEKICSKLLANPVMENYSFTISQAEKAVRQ